MPMSFPDMASLRRGARVHGFRELGDGEDEEMYRLALAEHVLPIDGIESTEILFGKGWDQFTDAENLVMVQRQARSVRIRQENNR